MIGLSLFVTGIPAPQGSKSYKGHSRAGKPILVESSRQVVPWREVVAVAVANEIRAQRWPCPDCPVRVELSFFLRRPPSAPRRRVWPDRKPDLDKLVRSTFDALKTAGAIADDARIVQLSTAKRYARPGARTGVFISINPIGGTA